MTDPRPDPCPDTCPDTRPDTRPETGRPTEVLVVGAGPVGLVLAIELARRDVAVRLVDSRPEPTTESRAIAVHARTLDHLEALGVLDVLAGRARVSTGMEFHDGGRTVGRLRFGSVRAAHPFSLAVAQTDTEAALAGRLAGLGVQVERSCAFVSLVQDAAGVDVVLDGPERVRTVRVAHVVGTDGARSVVRRAIGQRLSGSFVGEEFLIGDVEGDHPYDDTVFHTFFAPGTASAVVFALPGRRLRVFAQLPPGTDPQRPATLDWLGEALAERGVEVRLDAAHWLARFEVKHGQVARYRAGRVFLAGDAAHIHSPAGGLGMNTGIQDAVNLAWKLAWSLRHADGGAELLLESYHEERHPVAASVIAFTTRLSRAGTLRTVPARRVRNTALGLALRLPPFAGRMADTVEQQRVGYRQGAVVCGRTVRGVHRPRVRAGDFLRLPGTSVAAELARHPDHLVVSLGDQVAALPVGLRHWDVDAVSRARLARDTGLGGSGVVVVRPDGYVGLVGRADQLPSYVARLSADGGAARRSTATT